MVRAYLALRAERRPGLYADLERTFGLGAVANGSGDRVFGEALGDTARRGQDHEQPSRCAG